MTAAPASLTALVAEALPDVQVVVTAFDPATDMRILHNTRTDEYILIAPLETGTHPPKPAVCARHGATRFEWNPKTKKYECVKCTQEG